MKRLSGLILICVLVFSNMVAQNTIEGSSVVISDDRIDSLVQLHIDYNKKYPVFQGYRIQILKTSGNSALDITEEAITGFSEKHPEVHAYLTFEEPYYRVRVGDFRTRLEAEKFLKKIKRKYPGAWVIQDYINFPILPKYINQQL